MEHDAREFFPQVKETSEGWRANCPRCEDKEWKLYWNADKGVGCCFHSDCAWFKDRGGVTERRLRSFFSRGGVTYTIPEIIKKSPEADLSLPKEFTLLEDLPDSIQEDIYDYLGHRGLLKKVLRTAMVGYCERGKFWGYIIFPVFNEEGEVVYWQGRRYKNRTPKFYNPKSSRKSELVYRIGISKNPKLIVVVESIINALTLDLPGSRTNLVVALLGKAMSSVQKDKILAYEKWAKELVIMLDGDARRDAVEIAASFGNVIPVKIATVPDGEDVNSLGREKAWELIRHAPIYSERRRMEFSVGVER